MLTTAGIEIVALDEGVKIIEPNVEAVRNFARANVPFDHISCYGLDLLLTEILS